LPEAPVQTVAVIVVELTTVKENAETPPKLTAVAPVKLVPVIMIIAEVAPLVGVNDVIVGNRPNKKPEIEALPNGVVTLMFPLAPVPTTAVMVVGDTTVKELAGTPPKLTAVAPVKFKPVIVTIVPVTPLPGVNDII
jgi:hypothetical protein